MASMTINEMRNFILQAYPTARPSWRNMIATTGNTQQICAIYFRIIGKGSKKKTEEDSAQKTKINKPVEEYHQIDMFEYLATLNKKGNTTQIEV